MAILDIIEFFDPSGEIIVAKLPPDSSSAIANGSQLIVQESQTAFIFQDGRAHDEFGPGRHDIVTPNIPLLASLQGLPYGFRSPFRCSVYFVSNKVFTNLGWGTSSPIVFRDSELRMVTLRAHGAYAIAVREPRTLLNTLVGSKGHETTYAIESYFKTHIVSTLNEVLASKLTTILDLPVKYSEITSTLHSRVRDSFSQYGIELVELVVEAVTVPPDVQDMLNKATGVAAQDAEKFRQVMTTSAIADAAKHGGAMGEGLGTGVGLGLGMAMGRELAHEHEHSAGDGGDAAPVSVEEIKAKLTSLKELYDSGLITESDYQTQKTRLLGRL